MTAERQPVCVWKSLQVVGVLDVVIMVRDVYILSSVETESTYTPARWLALERACHRLHSLIFVSVSFIHCSSSRSGKVFVSSSRFVLRLATVQALCNLARVVLELHHPLLLVAFRESLRELLEVRVAPRHCTGPVQPGTCSSRASSSTAPRRVQGKSS